MTNEELDQKILEALKKPLYSQVSPTTRAICNDIFQFERNGYIVRPGTHKMQWVYSRLSSLAKRKKVMGGSGLWKIAPETENA